MVRHGSSTRTQECAVTALDAPNASPATESDDAFKWIKECTQNASQPHSTVLSFVSQKQKLKTSNFFWLSHQWNNYFWSTTQTQSNNNNFCYIRIDYCNTFNGVCTVPTYYVHVSPVITNLYSFFQNLKIVTHLLTKQEHFYMLSIAKMCEWEVRLRYFWSSSHVLEVTTRLHYLIYIAETPEWVIQIKIGFSPFISLPCLLFHSVTLECRDIDTLHPFHLG